VSDIAAPKKRELKTALNFQVTVFVAVRVVISTTFRMIYPFLSIFAKGLGVDLRTFSYAVTTRSLMGLISPFFASVADSRGRKSGMLIGIITYTGAISLVVIWPTFPAFFIALSLASIGYLIFIPSMQAYLGDRVPYENRGRVLGITEFAWSLSAIIGIPLVGFIIARKGWLAPFSLIALLGALSFLLLAWMLPKDITPKAGETSIWKNLSKVFSYPPAIAALVMTVLYTAANETVTLVYGVWVEQAFTLSIASLAATALAIGISEFGGEVLVTLFTDKMGKRKAIVIGLIGNCIAALAIPILGRWMIGAMLSLFLFYLTFEFTLVSAIPLMTEILPSARATMMATHWAVIALGRSVGDLLAPSLYTHSAIPGITLNALVAIGFNLLAMIFLTQVKLQHGQLPAQEN
jgi:predicted MFS family arabinose efflux permease